MKTYGQLLVEGNKMSDEAFETVKKYKEKIASIVDEFREDYNQIRSSVKIDTSETITDEIFQELLTIDYIAHHSANKAVEELESTIMYITKAIAYGSNIVGTISSLTPKTSE